MALNFPASPSNGDVYPDAPNSEYIYNSTKGAWESLPTEAAKTITSDTAPVNPKDGDQWFNTVDGTLYIYVVDFDGGQWVESQAPITANGYYSPNYIINGAFDIWQRGTSFSNTAFVYTTDRWVAGRGAFDTGMSVTQQTGIAGIRFCSRVQRVSGNTSVQNIRFGTTLESAMSIPLAGKTVTLSFYARAGANYSSAASALGVYLRSGTTIDAANITAADNFGTGAASVVETSFTLTTSWQRFSMTGVVSPTATQLGMAFSYLPVGTAGANDWFEVTGVQVEEGTVATTFRRNANSLQGELAACQRYYYRQGGANLFQPYGFGASFSTTGAVIPIITPVQMRVPPTSLEFSLIGLQDNLLAGVYAVTTATISQASPTVVQIDCGVSSGLTALRPTRLLANNSLNSFVAISSEL